MGRLNSQQEVFFQLQEQLAALSARIYNLEQMHSATIKYIQGTSYIVNTTINAGVTYTTGDLRGTNGIPLNAAGVFLVAWTNFPVGAVATGSLQGGPSDETLDVYSTKLWFENSAHGEESSFMMIKLGPDGKIILKAITVNIPLFVVVCGYWI